MRVRIFNSFPAPISINNLKTQDKNLDNAAQNLPELYHIVAPFLASAGDEYTEDQFLFRSWRNSRKSLADTAR